MFCTLAIHITVELLSLCLLLLIFSPDALVCAQYLTRCHSRPWLHSDMPIPAPKPGRPSLPRHDESQKSSIQAPNSSAAPISWATFNGGSLDAIPLPAGGGLGLQIHLQRRHNLARAHEHG